MFKRVLFAIAILALALTACAGKEAELPPTMSPADVQSTAVSSASTIMAATQMAQPPTATFIPPPTETPLPSPTPLPTFTPELALPTPDLSIAGFPTPIIQATPTTAPAVNMGGECNKVLDVAEAGQTYPVRIQNQTGGTVTLSLFLYTNGYGQCGYMPGIPPIQGTATFQLPVGSWSFYALIDYGNHKSGNYSGAFTVQATGNIIVKILKQ